MRPTLPFLGLLAIVSGANAEVVTEFEPFLHDTDRPEVLALDGNIGPRTASSLQRAMERFEGVTTLQLASYGGTVFDALPLAYYVRTMGLKTDIPVGKDCASACSYLFFAGVGRSAEGRLGVHAIDMPSNDLKAGQRALGEIFRAFEDFGVPSRVHTRMMATPADNMYWFDTNEMTMLGLIGQIGAGTSDPELLAELSSQLALEAVLPAWTGPPADITPAQIATVERQRQTVAANPDDIVARETLASYEAAIGNHRVAREQMSIVITLRGSGASSDDYTKLARYMVAAAGGQVSSEAEATVRRILQFDETDGIALYFLGLMYGQNGRGDTGFAIWRDLQSRSTPDDPWYDAIRNQIGQLAAQAGVRNVPVFSGIGAPVSPPPADPPANPLEAARDAYSAEGCGFTANGDYVCGGAPGTAPQPAQGGESDSATDNSPQTGGAVEANFPAPSGLAIFAAALMEQDFSATSWSGPVSQPSSDRPYSMRLFLSGQFLKVDYPELACGGYWELADNSNYDVVVFTERLVYGQSNCVDGGTINLHIGAGDVFRYEFSVGGVRATATLRPG